jgi:FkbM family methyltransferase
MKSNLFFPFKKLFRAIAKVFENAFNVRVYRTLPRGIDPFYDLKRLVPHWLPKVIFDVGANIGQSASGYSRQFPQSEIFSFEPASQTFDILKKNVSIFQNVKCFKCAFASEVKRGVMKHGEHSDINRLVSKVEEQHTNKNEEWEYVEQNTIDNFCSQNGITKINYLKIDTEGYDLNVLKGAEDMLAKSMIDVIEVEVGISSDNELHVPLQEIKIYLEMLNYRVFGFYEQFNEWKRNLPHLRRANAVFISSQLNSGVQ